MATGDCTITIAIQGGSTKTSSFVANVKDKSILYLKRGPDSSASMTDEEWAIFQVNKMAGAIVDQANRQIEMETSISKQSYTPAT